MPDKVDRFDYLQWQEEYKALDRLWMDSGVGERFAYGQLARPKSDFMRQTRSFAAGIESGSNVPTYAFLMHYHQKWGKHCPLCGRKWGWKDSPEDVFAFKCEPCRLIASEASDGPKKLRELHR